MICLTCRYKAKSPRLPQCLRCRHPATFEMWSNDTLLLSYTLDRTVSFHKLSALKLDVNKAPESRIFQWPFAFEPEFIVNCDGFEDPGIGLPAEVEDKKFDEATVIEKDENDPIIEEDDEPINEGDKPIDDNGRHDPPYTQLPLFFERRD